MSPERWQVSDEIDTSYEQNSIWKPSTACLKSKVIRPANFNQNYLVSISRRSDTQKTEDHRLSEETQGCHTVFPSMFVKHVTASHLGKEREEGPAQLSSGDQRRSVHLCPTALRDRRPQSLRAQMPIQPSGKETEEMEAEGDSAAEMNGEADESEEERSGSQTESEEESSEMDDEDYERRRSECVSEMLDLEKQFSELKEKLFRERLSQLRLRLEEVGAERAPEYTEPLGGLQQSLKIRIQVAGIYKGFCLDVIRNKYECELQGAKQHLESEKLLLYDTLLGELQERIQRLEEDRQSLDISSEWWDDKLHSRGSSKTWDSVPPSKRKKAPLVSGPYIVYMLQEIDILEDWTAIKKARAAVSPQKRKADGP